MCESMEELIMQLPSMLEVLPRELMFQIIGYVPESVLELRLVGFT